MKDDEEKENEFVVKYIFLEINIANESVRKKKYEKKKKKMMVVGEKGEHINPHTTEVDMEKGTERNI